MTIPEFQYEALVHGFVENLMKYPGAYVRVPRPLTHKANQLSYDEEMKKVFVEVGQMLQMMGIPYSAIESGLLIKVDAVPGEES